MRYDTNDQIHASIADLTERLRAVRIEQGLPEEPPERVEFVDIPLSLVLIDRLQTFRAIIVKYASVLASGEVTRIDTNKLTEYTQMGRLLSHSKGFFSGLHSIGITGALSIINRVNEAIDTGKTEDLDINGAMRQLHFCVGFMTRDDGIRHDGYDYEDETGKSIHEEKNRLLSDPAILQAEIDVALAQLDNKGDDTHE